MTEITPTLTAFINNIEESQLFWALLDETGEGWVVCDSSEYEETDVMPVWSSEEEANKHCIEEWSGYKPAAISIREYLEIWVDDLNNDGVLMGVDWILDGDCHEIDPIELAKHLVEIEAEEH
ncbi:DUF2750 domain-containing protein [Parashewanella curva]|uniref:DUF2750 domain-containing protein n=1 Tax=Parashewanella curva TaxID=2338552 RepID=A0A3L8Q2J6_9GAMM|nr:DUF2750 domain-containing protein [Parashewanella curva]RLV60632.1 DUF2750 domain-containing protein [Parashewanella curva]